MRRRQIWLFTHSFSGRVAAAHRLRRRTAGIHVTLIEPGGVRTELAGASMHVADIRSVYRPTGTPAVAASSIVLT